MKKTLEERFWEKVDASAGPSKCWLWTAYKDDLGYGRISLNGTAKLSHRVSYEINGGQIPEGMLILHSCDNPPCCNPAHLRPGTLADNQRDMITRKRRKGYISVETAEAIRLSPLTTNEIIGLA